MVQVLTAFPVIETLAGDVSAYITAYITCSIQSFSQFVADLGKWQINFKLINKRSSYLSTDCIANTQGLVKDVYILELISDQYL